VAQEEKESSDLALADRHIVEARARIALQQTRVDALIASGSESDQATDLLKTMEQTLDQFLAHRATIVEKLERP